MNYLLSLIISILLYVGIYHTQNEPTRSKCVILRSYQKSDLFQAHIFDDTTSITHYYKGNLILYNIPRKVIMSFNVAPDQEENGHNISSPKEIQQNIFEEETSRIEMFDNYYLREKGSSHALMLKEPEQMKAENSKTDYEFLSFDDKTSYESNLGLAYVLPQINKKLIKSEHPSNDVYIDTYLPIVIDKNRNNLDSIIVIYNKKMLDCPFSFGKEIDIIHKSKAVNIRVFTHHSIGEKVYKSFHVYEIKEEPIKKPAKIDSIFTKLIPLLPKKYGK